MGQNMSPLVSWCQLCLGGFCSSTLPLYLATVQCMEQLLSKVNTKMGDLGYGPIVNGIDQDAIKRMKLILINKLI